MIEALKFVRGALDAKTFIPSMAHFCIRDGMVYATNGRITLGAPIDVDLRAVPHAKSFLAAVAACDKENEPVTMRMTAGNRLRVTSGKFSCLVNCLDVDDFPPIAPLGEPTTLPANTIDALQQLLPFASDNTAHAWATTLFFKNGSAFASNNVMLAEVWLGTNSLENVVVPREACREILRVATNPSYACTGKNVFSVVNKNNSFVSAQVSTYEWPDLRKHLQAINHDAPPVPEELLPAVNVCAPFVDSAYRDIILSADGVRVEDNVAEYALDLRAIVDDDDRIFSLQNLVTVLSSADKMDAKLPDNRFCFVSSTLRGIGVTRAPR